MLGVPCICLSAFMHVYCTCMYLRWAKSPIPSVQRTLPTLAGHSAVPLGTSTTPIYELQRTLAIRIAAITLASDSAITIARFRPSKVCMCVCIYIYIYIYISIFFVYAQEIAHTPLVQKNRVSPQPTLLQPPSQMSIH